MTDVALPVAETPDELFARFFGEPAARAHPQRLWITVRLPSRERSWACDSRAPLFCASLDWASFRDRSRSLSRHVDAFEWLAYSRMSDQPHLELAQCALMEARNHRLSAEESLSGSFFQLESSQTPSGGVYLLNFRWMSGSRSLDSHSFESLADGWRSVFGEDAELSLVRSDQALWGALAPRLEQAASSDPHLPNASLWSDISELLTATELDRAAAHGKHAPSARL